MLADTVLLHLSNIAHPNIPCDGDDIIVEVSKGNSLKSCYLRHFTSSRLSIILKHQFDTEHAAFIRIKLFEKVKRACL